MHSFYFFVSVCSGTEEIQTPSPFYSTSQEKGVIPYFFQKDRSWTIAFFLFFFAGCCCVPTLNFHPEKNSGHTAQDRKSACSMDSPNQPYGCGCCVKSSLRNPKSYTLFFKLGIISVVPKAGICITTVIATDLCSGSSS